jgi:hypothetical protein
METKPKVKITIEKGWAAFVKDGKFVGIKEFKLGGSADTILEVINKPTKAEVEVELASRNISIPN